MSIKTLVVGTGCGTQQASAPDEYYHESDAFDGESLSEDDGRSGTDDETEIEDRGGKRIAVADGQSKVGTESKESLTCQYARLEVGKTLTA
ncbi:hypothetical protein ES702_05402 [subsurface metagenome]